MIVKEKGHFRSFRSSEERGILTGYELGDLSLQEREAAMMILEEEVMTGASLVGEEISKDQWEIIPAPIEQWINDPDLVGDIHKSIFPQHKKDIIEFFNGNYHEYILTGGIGVGKTFTATVCIMRVLYELLCLRDPQVTLGLSPGSPLYIAPISRTKELARRVAFGQIAGKLNLSPFFRGKFIETKEEIRFPGKGIFIIGGTSNNNHILGMDVIAGMVDEGNFMGKGKMTTMSDDEAYDKAEIIYNGLVARIQSRFSRHGVKGFVFLVSSKRGAEDFTERRIKAAQEAGDKVPDSEDAEGMEAYTQSLGVFVRDYSAWDVAPGAYADQKWYTLAYNPETGRSRIAPHKSELKRGEEAIDFPNDFLPDFQRDPIGSLRDKAGVSVEVAHPFITNRTHIDEMMSHDIPHIFSVDEWSTDEDLTIYWDKFMTTNLRGEPVPICCPNALRHVALDMSAKEDATGFCMGHDAGMTRVVRRDHKSNKEVEEFAPVIHIDAVLRIVPPSIGEIEHEAVRNLVYTFQENGVHIKTVSMDQWSRPPNAQLLKKHGLKVIELSMDRKPTQYLAARSALYEGRVKTPFSKVLRKELRRLERNDKGKVDHPPRGCFTGDTLVRLADGSCVTFEALAAMSAEELAEVKVIGYKNGAVVTSVSSAGITKHVDELIELELENGEIIRCTPDHLFMLEDGSWIEAQYLTPEHDLKSLVEMKIKSVRRIKLEKPVPVFDITVPLTENFALASGPVVHNSKDLADVWGATIWHLTETSSGGKVYVPSKGFSATPKADGSWQTGGNYMWPDENKSDKDEDKGLPRYIVI